MSGEDKTMYNTVFKKLLDIGDIIGITGNVFVTKVGEISVNVRANLQIFKTIASQKLILTEPLMPLLIQRDIDKDIDW